MLSQRRLGAEQEGTRTSTDSPRELSVATSRAGFSADFFFDHVPYHRGISEKRGEEVLGPVPGFGEWSPCGHGSAHVGGTVSVPWWFSGLAEVPGVPAPVVSPLKMHE